MNKTKIEWTDYTWNPVTGCNHGCGYCYARRIAMRFDGHFNPTFHPERLQQPYKQKKASKIFVGSMADLFGEWVPIDWIQQVIKVAKDNPQHTFQFLTKNPKRYHEFQFPSNCWLGVTITHPSLLATNQLKLFRSLSNCKFISAEPLLGDVGKLNFKNIDLIIVGAMTGPKAIPPQKKWVKNIKHLNIFYKDNIKKYLTTPIARS